MEDRLPACHGNRASSLLQASGRRLKRNAEAQRTLRTTQRGGSGGQASSPIPFNLESPTTDSTDWHGWCSALGLLFERAFI